MFHSLFFQRWVAIFLLLSFILIACQKTADFNYTLESSVPNAAHVAVVSPIGKYVPNEVIVKFKVGSTDRVRGSVLDLIDGSIIEQIFTPAMEAKGEELGVFLINTPLEVNQAIARLQADSRVEYAEPNFIYQHQAVSNDPYFTNGSLWGMYGTTGTSSTLTNTFGSQASVAWANNKTGSSDVYIGIIDEGVMFNHPDLSANCWINPHDLADGIDNDGNGYIDDIRGWDFDGNNNTTFDGVGDDHGTHVAGTIGGKGGNGAGVAGVCWSVTLINAKFLGARGGTTANAIKAVDYFTDLKTRHGLRLVATNNSWGGGGFAQSLYDAIMRARSAGILFIAAAGNNSQNLNVTPSYPASYDCANIISVASITNTGALSSFSNYGLTSVDLGAPGSGIWSTIPKSSKGSVIAGYASYSGTSMATPHVTGAVALYASLNPSATYSQIKATIEGQAIVTPSLEGKCVTNGRLNVAGF